MEREIRSDLAKIVTALNVYLEEHDGGFPYQYLPGVPRRYEKWDPRWKVNGYFGSGDYSKAITGRIQSKMAGLPIRHRWDPARYAVVAAPFCTRGGQFTRTLVTKDFSGVYAPRNTQQQGHHVSVVRRPD